MRSTGKASVAVALAAAWLSTSARAGEIHVPGDAATVQGGIVLAANGDDVLVAPGVWHEVIDLAGKDLRVIGTGGAAVTVLDAMGIGGPVLTLAGGEPATAEVRGFTLTGGTGHVGSYVSGGGVYAPMSSATVRECVITGNVANGAPLGKKAFGGGVHLGSDKSRLVDCVVSGNSTDGSGGGARGTGQGLSAQMTGCSFVGNHADGEGGGLFTGRADGCNFERNTAGGNGGGVALELSGSVTASTIIGNTAGGDGGGAYLQSGFLSTSTIEGNVAGGSGGGVWSYSSSSGLNMVGCHFRGNAAAAIGGGAKLEVGSDSPFASLHLDACTFQDNEAPDGDGLVASAGAVSTLLGHCTFSGDGLSLGGKVLAGHLIVWDHVPAIESSGELVLDHSDIAGGWRGPGNIDADPMFVDAPDGDLHLAPGSPCINAGNPAGPPDPDGSPPDMGAYAYEPWSDLGGGVAGTFGLPELTANGPLTGDTAVVWSLQRGRPDIGFVLIVGFSEAGVSSHGGVLWPMPDVVLTGMAFGHVGTAAGKGRWPVGVPSGTGVWLQAWYADPGAVAGLAGSNGVRGVAP